jgi:hypothetical protein
MIQLTPTVECIWLKGLLAFDCAAQVADIQELQVRCPMRVVELDFESEGSWSRGMEALEATHDWHVITNELAEEMLMTCKEIYLEFGYSHLEFRPPVDSLYRVRACTAAKHVDDDIFGLEDVHPALLEAFTKHPTLV